MSQALRPPAAIRAVARALGVVDRVRPGSGVRLALALERRRAGLSAARQTVDGLELHFTQGGRGEPLLLLHGIGADKDHFTRVAAHLTPHYRVVAVDLPGFGDSTRNRRLPHSPEAQVERLRAFVRARGLGRVHLGGSSMGGFIAAQWASRYPDEVRSLWLLGPAGVAANDSEMLAEFRRSGRCLLFARDEAEFRAVLKRCCAKEPWLPANLVEVLAARAARDHDLHLDVFHELLLGDLLDDAALGRVTAKTLVVWGAEDRILDPSGGPVFQRGIPGATLRVMDGIGHLPMVEDPRTTALDYLRFQGKAG